MTVPSSHAIRREARQPRAEQLFGENADAALDLFELTEYAWHNCFGEVTPPDAVIDDMFVCSEGRLAGLARAARLAVEDYRNLRLWADELRGKQVPILGIEQDDWMSDADVRFPEHDYPSDFELWLEPDGVVMIRSGIKITELSPAEARNLGQALIELADAAISA